MHSMHSESWQWDRRDRRVPRQRTTSANGSKRNSNGRRAILARLGVGKADVSHRRVHVNHLHHLQSTVAPPASIMPACHIHCTCHVMPVAACSSVQQIALTSRHSMLVQIILQLPKPATELASEGDVDLTACLGALPALSNTPHRHMCPACCDLPLQPEYKPGVCMSRRIVYTQLSRLRQSMRKDPRGHSLGQRGHLPSIKKPFSRLTTTAQRMSPTHRSAAALPAAYRHAVSTCFCVACHQAHSACL